MVTDLEIKNELEEEVTDEVAEMDDMGDEVEGDEDDVVLPSEEDDSDEEENDDNDSEEEDE